MATWSNLSETRLELEGYETGIVLPGKAAHRARGVQVVAARDRAVALAPSVLAHQDGTCGGAVKECLWTDPIAAEGATVDFRLTYAGPLLPDRAGVAKHKHDLRKHFHGQLRQLWQARPHLQDMQHPSPEEVLIDDGHAEPRGPRADYLAGRFQRNGYRFVPLVTRDLVLSCAIETLFLRPEMPGGIIQHGDIDNRVKTLFDGLKMPGDSQDLGPYTTPEQGEDPFCVLVEDDSLITSLSVEATS